jgi:predicted transcriptional regulator
MAKVKPTEGERIKKRIDELGLKNTHVAKRCKIHPVTLANIITGVNNSPKTISKINLYLDTVRT